MFSFKLPSLSHVTSSIIQVLKLNLIIAFLKKSRDDFCRRKHIKTRRYKNQSLKMCVRHCRQYQKMNTNEICKQLQDHFSKKNGFNRISWVIRILFFVFFTTHIFCTFSQLHGIATRDYLIKRQLYSSTYVGQTNSHTRFVLHIYTQIKHT